MIKKIRVSSLFILLISSILSFHILANDHGVVVTGNKIIELPNVSQLNCDQDKDKSCSDKKIPKKITVNTIRLSPNFKQQLQGRFKQLEESRAKGVSLPIQNKVHSISKAPPNPNQEIIDEQFTMDLGMENVPVYDQGVHGTCTIFASTAAIEAIKQSGEYISQQCLLELGIYQEQESNYQILSGWDGAEYPDILNRISNYGIVDKNTCPHKYAVKGHSMSPWQYYSYSFYGQWAKDFTWKKISMKENGYHFVNKIKQIIDRNHRVLIGSFIIYDYTLGMPYKSLDHGLYDLPEGYGLSEFIRDLNQDKINEHSMIIIGYDEETQIFKLRNSLGSSYGNNGDFYMSYEYLITMLTEAIEIY